MSNERNIHSASRPRRGMRPGRGMVPGEKAKDLKGALGKILRYMGKYKIAVVFVMIIAACSTVFSVLGPKVLGKATTGLAEGLMAKVAGTGGIDFTYIGKILLFVLGLYLLSSVLSFIQGWIMTGITQKICYRMRKEITEKINRMPMKYFESRTYGEVLSRITNDVDTLGMGLNQSVTQIITSTATIIGVLVMMLSISPLMTLIALVVLPVSGICVSLVVKKSQKHFITQQEYLGHINGQVEESYGGHLVIKAYSKEEEMISRFNQTNDVLYASAWKSQFLSGIMMPIMQFIGNIGYAAVALSGGMLAIRGIITIGDIQAFIQYVKNFTQPIQQIAQVTNQVQSMAAAAERVFEFLEEKEEDQIVEQPADVTKVVGNVEFDHVSFAYPEAGENVITDISFKAEKGETVAIIGSTGSGKSTLINLIPRFYDATEGSVKVDGVDVREMTQKDVRDRIGYVPQKGVLFSGTIDSNIRYGKTEISEDAVKKAAQVAQATEFIDTKPEGYDSPIAQGGSNVSGGQKQRLSIARAIAKDPEIFIFDDSFSALDFKTDSTLRKALKEHTKEATTIIVAQRISTILNADKIIVLDDGHMAGIGSHKELMKSCEVYRQIAMSQLSEEELA